MQVGDLGDALRWIVDLTLVLARAPYKEADTVFTLVNTTRTDVSHLPISNKSSSVRRDTLQCAAFHVLIFCSHTIDAIAVFSPAYARWR